MSPSFAVVLLCLAVLLSFPRLLRLDSIPLFLDTPAFHVPMWCFLLDALGRGEVPLWCPGIYLGYPLHAYGEAGLLYPPHFLVAHLFSSPGACVAFLLLLHHVVAAVSMFSFCRLGFSLSSWASLAGGLCFSLGGYMVLRQVTAGFFGAVSWAPLCLLTSLPWVYKKRPFLSSVALLLPLISGHALAWVMSLFLWAFLNLLATAKEALSGDIRGASSRLLWMGLSLAFHLAFGAAQLLPGVEFVFHSPRAKGLTLREAAWLSMEPRHLPLLFAPWLCGEWGGKHCPPYAFAFGAWVGLGGLLLALVAFLQPETRRKALIPASLSLFGLWVAFGPKAGLFVLLHKVPGFSIFRCPSHFLLWWSLGLSTLTALGVEALLKGQRRLRTATRLGVAFLLGASLLRAGSIGEWRPILPPLVVFSFQAWPLPPVGRLLSLWAELTLEARQVRRFMRAWRLERPPSIAQFLSAFDGHGRALNPAGGDRRFTETAIKGQMGLLWRLKILVEPGKPMPPLRYATAFPYFMRSPRLRLAAAVKFLILRRWRLAGARRVMACGSDVLFLLPEEPPFARLFGRVKVAHSFEEALRLTKKAPPEMAIVERPPWAKTPIAIGDGSGEALILTERANELLLLFRSRWPSLLLVSQMWYPGWRAWVDGKEAPVMPAEFVATAVPLPTGRHLVRFVFHPSTFSVGLYISLLSLASLFGALAAKLMSRAR